MTGRAVRSVWVGAPALLTALLIATVGALALVVGVAGVVPALAATATYTYDTATYAYDGTALLSSPNTGAADARGSRSGREAGSWVNPVSVARDVDAANTGPRMLPIGPWGQRVVDARTKLPGSWGPGVPNKKNVGTRWFDPSNPGNGVRIDQGSPGSPQLSQQVDHVVVRSGGKVIGPDGKPIVGSLSENPQAHIPLTDWMSWSSWNAP